MSTPGFQRSAEVAERRARVLQLRIEQRPYTEIAALLGVTLAVAKMDYKRALDQLQAANTATAGKARDVELAKLDQLEQAVWEVLRRRHITVQHGKIVGKYVGVATDPETGQVVRDVDDKPIPLYEDIEDDAPVLQAADRLVRIAQRRAALTGMDAPAKIEVSDATSEAIRRLAADLAAGVGAVEPGGETAPPGDPEAGQGSTPAP